MLRNIFALILILAAVGIAVFSARPLYEEAKKAALAKSEVEGVLKEFQKLRKVRDELLKTYNSISREDLSKLGKFLPSRPESSTLLVNLENLSRANVVLLKKVDIRERKEGVATLPAKKVSEKLPIELVVAGSYEAFRAFLATLEENLRLVDVEAISFIASEGNNQEFQIKARAYYAPF